MTVWWATYPVGGDISTGNGYTDREVVVSPSQHLKHLKNHNIGRKDHDKLLWL